MPATLCDKLRPAASLAAALTALVAASAHAGAPSAAKPAPTPAAQALTPKKADPAMRAAAERMDPLARATFWARELDADPADPVAGVRLASALRAMGRYDEAFSAAERVLVVRPDDVEALLEQARAKIGQGQSFYAVAPLEHAQKAAPGDWRPPALLGVAYAEVKRDADSRAAYARALQLSPDNPSVLSNMGMALATRGDAAGAEVLLRKAAAQPTATAQERQNLALVLGYEGKLSEAEELIRRDLPPPQADANLAYLRSISGGREVSAR